MSVWQDFREIADVRAYPDVRDLSSDTILSQYSNSKTITLLADAFRVRIDPEADIALFYEKIFHIMTAEGVGLDTWGRILAMGRTITDPDTDETLTLDDDYYRLLLLYKALANISPSDAASLNYLLATLINTGIAEFPRAAYVLEVDTMVIRWVFEDFLNPVQLAVFKAAGTLARGAGVGWELYAVNPDRVFGFNGSGMHPFNQAPFAPDTALLSNRR